MTKGIPSPETSFQSLRGVRPSLEPMNARKPCPYRCFLSEVSQHLSSRRTFRLLGTVVDLRPVDDTIHRILPRFEDQTDDNESSTKQEGLRTRSQYTCLALDDGSGRVVPVVARHAMVQHVRLVLGLTAECLVEAMAAEPTDSSEHNVSDWLLDNHTLLHVTQLVRVDDPHLVPLRWLELSFRRKLRDAPPQTRQDINMQFGYPTRNMISSSQLFDIISAEAMVGNQQGVTLEEMVIVLGLPQDKLAAVLEDLQLSGQVYRNESGGYVPL